MVHKVEKKTKSMQQLVDGIGKVKGAGMGCGGKQRMILRDKHSNWPLLFCLLFFNSCFLNLSVDVLWETIDNNSVFAFSRYKIIGFHSQVPPHCLDWSL